MSTTVIQLGKTGDIVSLLPCLKARAENGDRCALMVCEQYAPLLDGVSYVDVMPFNGTVMELRRAYEYARTLSDKVISTQVIGDWKDVQELTYLPSGTEHATTDCAVKEAWRLAGHLALWKTQPPVVFDRRSPEREKALLESVKKQVGGYSKSNRAEIVLLFLGGETHSFPYKELLKELLFSRPHARRRFVDLGQIKAEQFYDLIGLYEIADCLITTDSAPLHLAQACPRLPVFCLSGDSPSYWHGSPWRPNYVFHCRYREFPREAVKLVERLDALGQAGCYNRREVLSGEAPRIIHIVSGGDITDENRAAFTEARFSWIKQYTTGNWTETIIDYGAPGRDSRTALKDDRRMPFLKDVLKLGMMRAADRDILCLTRGVTHLKNDATELILANPLCYSHRLVKSSGTTSFHPACDVFCFTKEWWKAHRPELPDFVLGNDAYWHRCLLELLKKHGAAEIPGLGFRHEVAKPNVLKVKSPRVAYNEQLASEFLSREGISHLFKPAHIQQPTVNLNRHALSAFGYNPSLIRFQNRLFMAYRHHQNETNSVLAMAELSESLEVLSNRAIYVKSSNGSVEDPRLFEFRGELWMGFVDGKLVPGEIRCQMRVGRLIEGNPWTVADVWTPEYGKNDGTAWEKNWGFFSLDEKLLCVYSQGPKERIVLEFDGKKIAAEHRSPSLNTMSALRSHQPWAFGTAKGGTAPLPYGDRLLQFFHSTLDNEPSPFYRRYYIGACTMETKPPYGVINLSSEPVLYGSEGDDLSELERSACLHRKEKVVFPAGAAWSRPGSTEGAWVSYGVNDCQCAISTIAKFNL